MEITLNSPAGQAPQVLQWETTVPAVRLAVLDDQLQAGPAAEGSDKSITCVVKTGPPETRTFGCILAGGLKTIPNGVVAVLRLHVPFDAPVGQAKVNIGRGVAVLPGLKEISVPPAESIVTVRPASTPARK